MPDDILVDGVEYVSSRRASELSGYAQDYIGQLARGGYIDAKRIGGLWHVSMESLREYMKSALTYKPRPPAREQTGELDSLISFDGKDYVSAARASELTGYNQDYVGQLARAGTVLSRQVGNRWYVDREALFEHKREKDALLAAVQAESVGLRTSTSGGFGNKSQARNSLGDEYLTYTKDTGDLMPPLRAENERARESFEKSESRGDEKQYIPIRVNRTFPREAILRDSYREEMLPKRSNLSRKFIFYGIVGAIALVGSLSLGFMALSREISLRSILISIGDTIERLIAPELTYKRDF